VDIDREALVQTFLAETEEGLHAMEEALVRLEIEPGDAETIDTIFRVAHTLKGNAGSLGYAEVARFAHVMEDLLDDVRAGRTPVSSALVTLLLQAADGLKEAVPDAVGGALELEPAQQALLAQLVALAEGNAVAPAVPAAETVAPRRRREDVSSDRSRSLRVDIEKLDRMLTLSGEISVARGRLRQMLEQMEKEELVEACREADRLSLDLQELVMKARMVPVGPTFRPYVRMVRDLAAANGKLARLTLEGEDAEVDMTVVEHIRDPLTHMVRNALDHGIESPEVRKSLGKDPCGSLVLRARHQSGTIVIELSDDGAGLSRKKIAARARARGVAEADRLSDLDLYRLVFEPGFSTAETVTDLSGRGVGMDVVRRNIDALRGSVGIESEEGAGTRVVIRLPLTLAVIQAFLVGVGGETYAMPLDTVVECVDLPAAERAADARTGVIQVRGKALPYVRLRRLFGLGGRPADHESVVVVEHDERHVGLAVDELLGESQAVIKPLGRLLHGVPGLSGSTILGNGRVALILDASILLRQAEAAPSSAASAAPFQF
jgi:two-component system chemotaxis sensor kinase CheA